jgi:hypothetical protein
MAKTLVKETVIAVIYGVVTCVAFILTVAWVARFG